MENTIYRNQEYPLELFKQRIEHKATDLSLLSGNIRDIEFQRKNVRFRIGLPSRRDATATLSNSDAISLARDLHTEKVDALLEKVVNLYYNKLSEPDNLLIGISA